MDDELHRVIGIDLGTTYSAVAAYNSDEESATILSDPEHEGNAAIAMPSVVRFDHGTGALVVGHEAKNSIGIGKSDTVLEIKREMGAEFTEESLAHFGVKNEFQVGEPVRARLGKEWLRPQEISALVLLSMKRIAEQTLGGDIHDAVVTVPAYFTERQKRATEEAALLAGLYPRLLIPEPTAAAIAYGVDKAESERQVYLVFDLGGGTFDVSIIETRDDKIDVIATAGDQRLGGGDFDDAITKWIIKQAGGALPSDPDRLPIKAAAEAAKRELSLRRSTTIDLGGTIPALELDRETFESLIQPTIDRSLHEVDKALQFANEKGVRRENIDAVLLVGGSTRIPRVRRMLLDHFEQDDGFVRRDANPDTIVARGAAVMAARFEATPEFDISVRPNRERSAEEQDYIVTLIAEHTLGVGVQEGRFSELIPRGTKIPAHQVKTYMNPDQATNIRADIYQGEGDYVYDNVLIGTIHLDDIEPRPENYHKFDVEFSLDENGLLGVRVIHTNTQREYRATFDQSTTIGKLDELALRRAVLAEMHANGKAANGADGPAEPPAPQPGPAITIPPPASGPSAAAEGSAQGNDANRD